MDEKTLDELAERTADIVSKMIKEIIHLADEHDVDRDQLLSRVIEVFSTMVMFGTFKKYEIGDRA